ncbi:MAG: DUF302 domain-containing protein [Gammaproteobacteria bacterium]|nr:DUF302 domain-containing protein [Gammaproteobacteria bacterium]
MNKLLKITRIIALVSCLAVMGLTPVMAAGHSSPMEVLIEIESPLAFEETIAKLRSNAKKLGWKVPKKWAKNFQKNLKYVTKVDVGRNLVVEMCEPYAAVDLLIHDKYKKFLAMMPCSVAIYEKSDGKVYLSMMNIRALAQMFSGKEIDDLVNKLAPQMDEMVKMQ